MKSQRRKVGSNKNILTKNLCKKIEKFLDAQRYLQALK
jgi:hypothetical protein